MPETDKQARLITTLVGEFREEYSTVRKEMEKEVHEQALHRVDQRDSLIRHRVFYQLMSWDIPVSEKRKRLGWSHQTYRQHMSFDRNGDMPDISSRLGVKYRRDPDSAEARTYLHRINLLQRKLWEPEWDSLPEAPVKKWTRQNPKPAKNEAVEKPNLPKSGAVKNEFEQKTGAEKGEWEVF